MPTRSASTGTTTSGQQLHQRRLRQFEDREVQQERRLGEELGCARDRERPWTICLTQGPTQYLYTSDAFPGRIYKVTLDGRVVGMLGRAGRQPGQFNWIHALACPSENELLVADMNNWRVQKLTLHPERVRALSSSP